MLNDRARVFYFVVPQPVKVRKYKVDKNSLIECLKSHKRYSNKEIALIMNLPVTKVEHWFRTDQFWAVPDEDSWFELKALLQITTTDFDSCITEFEYRNGVYDKSERIYLTDFIAPCLTTESATEKFLVRKG
ncbi:MAG: hypothetical protein J5710_13750 [Treponema sp.]|nr:hypothetical protein [Treponema sp.]